MGETLANESVEAAKKIVASVPAPPGVTAYVTGPSALIADTHIAGDRSLQLITGLTFGVITVMLLFVYRSIVTVVLALIMVFLELAVARGVVAFAGHHHLIQLSTFAVNLLTMMAIAAATDYVIFLFGRYQEARGRGVDKESAYYEMFHGTAHVILGSGLTIAGAMLCLHFTRSPMFNSLGVPLFIGMLVVVAAALTLGPAVVTVASTLRCLEPKRAMRVRFWRRIGTAVVRWPGPDPGRHRCAVPGRAAGPARLPHRLQRPALPAAGHPGRGGLRGGRTALPVRAAEPRTADDRERPRHAELSGLPGHRPGRQVDVPPAGHRAGADHHPAAGHPRRAQFDSVHDRHAGHRCRP